MVEIGCKTGSLIIDPGIRIFFYVRFAILTLLHIECALSAALLMNGRIIDLSQIEYSVLFSNFFSSRQAKHLTNTYPEPLNHLSAGLGPLFGLIAAGSRSHN